MSFNNIGLPYQSPLQREQEATPKQTLRLSPFNMQRVVFELVKQHWLYDDPATSGYNFDDRYSLNDSDSGILLDMSFNQKLSTASKRPAIFVSRSDASFGSPVMNQNIAVNPQESEQTKLHIVSMNLAISCIATPVALAEQLADWTSASLLQYESQIRCDYRLRRFRMSGILRPQEYKEQKDHFIVVINIETVFDAEMVICGDNLKLKTISKTIFLGLQNNQPLINQ